MSIVIDYQLALVRYSANKNNFQSEDYKSSIKIQSFVQQQRLVCNKNYGTEIRPRQNETSLRPFEANFVLKLHSKTETGEHYAGEKWP